MLATSFFVIDICLVSIVPGYIVWSLIQKARGK